MKKNFSPIYRSILEGKNISTFRFLAYFLVRKLKSYKNSWEKRNLLFGSISHYCLQVKYFGNKTRFIGFSQKHSSLLGVGKKQLLAHYCGEKTTISSLLWIYRSSMEGKNISTFGFLAYFLVRKLKSYKNKKFLQ